MSIPSKYSTIRNWVNHRIDKAPLLMGLIFLLALGARLTQIVASPDNALVWSDAETYHHIAVNLTNGEWFSYRYIFFSDDRIEDGRTAWRLPLFPALVAVVYWVFGPHPLLAVYLQSLVSAATVVVVYLLGLEVWRDRLVAVIAGFLTAIFGPFILMTSILMPETLFIFLVTLGILLVLRAHTSGKTRYQLAAGAVLGLATLTRAEGAALTLLIVLWLVGVGLLSAVRRRAASGNDLWPSVSRVLRSAAVVTAVFVLILTPWTLRNFTVFHEFIPLTTSFGSNLWAGNNPYIGREIGEKETEFRQPFFRDGRMLEGKQDKAFRRLALAYIRENPGAFFTRVKDRYLQYWRQGDIENLLDQALPWMLFKPIYYLGFLGMFLSLRRPLLPFPIWLPILFFPILYSVLGVSLSVHRWRLVTEPCWILFASYAIGCALHGLQAVSRVAVLDTDSSGDVGATRPPRQGSQG